MRRSRMVMAGCLMSLGRRSVYSFFLPKVALRRYGLSSLRAAGAVPEQHTEPAHAVAVAGDSYKLNLLEASETEISALLGSMEQPKYRIKQVLKWVKDGVTSVDGMTDLPKDLRAKLSDSVTLGTMQLAAEQISRDGTKKRAYRLHDGQLIESVLMPYSDGRKTACISSQAGCAMGCVFCATGQMGFSRQLTSAEIFEQAYLFAADLAEKNERLSNVVLMGMGEPLANYDAVMKACRRIISELGIGARHITISTVGLVPRIERLAKEDLQIRLAISLHAARDEERSALLPVNRRFPLAELMRACKQYAGATGRRITFEWALINGENDSPQHAEALVRLLKPLKGLCHVNIIPLNPTSGYSGGAGGADALTGFVNYLEDRGIPATARVRRGLDISAGCGQLKAEVEKGGRAAAEMEEVLGKGFE